MQVCEQAADELAGQEAQLVKIEQLKQAITAAKKEHARQEKQLYQKMLKTKSKSESQD